MDTYKFGKNEDKFYEKIYEEFGKTKSDVNFYVNTLMNWAKDQPHFPEIPSVNACIFFISSCKCSIEKAKGKIDMYYTIRRLIPEIFTVHPLSLEMVTHSKIAYCIPLPKMTNKNERVLYLRLNENYEPEDFLHERWIIQVIHVLELLTQEDKCNNLHIIFDSAGQKLAHISRFSAVLLKKFLVIFEKVYSARMASILMLNVPHYAEIAFNNVFIPLLPEKLRHRLTVDKGTSAAFEKFSKDILPKDIEGDEKSLEELHEMLYRKFEEMKPRFDKIQYMTTNESLRPTKLENDDTLGYYGSFRKIDVD